MIGPQVSGSWAGRLPSLVCVSARVVDEHGLVGLLRHTAIRELSLECLSSASADAMAVIGSLGGLRRLSLQARVAPPPSRLVLIGFCAIYGALACLALCLLAGCTASASADALVVADFRSLGGLRRLSLQARAAFSTPEFSHLVLCKLLCIAFLQL